MTRRLYQAGPSGPYVQARNEVPTNEHSQTFSSPHTSHVSYRRCLAAGSATAAASARFFSSAGEKLQPMCTSLCMDLHNASCKICHEKVSFSGCRRVEVLWPPNAHSARLDELLAPCSSLVAPSWRRRRRRARPRQCTRWGIRSSFALLTFRNLGCRRCAPVAPADLELGTNVQ